MKPVPDKQKETNEETLRDIEALAQTKQLLEDYAQLLNIQYSPPRLRYK